MTTERKREANRNNALKSTGPKTANGLAHSSGNALKTGLHARKFLLPGEDEAAYKRLQRRVHKMFQPRDIVEAWNADTITWLLWRLERLNLMENAMLRKINAERRERAARGLIDDDVLTTGLRIRPGPLVTLAHSDDAHGSDEKEFTEVEVSLDPAETLLVAYFSETTWPNLEKIERLRRATNRDLERYFDRLKATQKERRIARATAYIEATGREPPLTEHFL